MGSLAAGLIVAGTVVSAGSAIAQGQAAKAQAKNQQSVANFNAQVADREAEAEEQRTAFAQERQQRSARAVRGTLRAKLAKSGAELGVGAPLALEAEQAAESELENLLIGFEGAERARSLRGQATGLRRQAKGIGAAGRRAATAGFIGAGATLLSGFGRVKSLEDRKGTRKTT